MEMKTCKVCKEIKSQGDFYKSNKHSCKECVKIQTAKWKKENLERKRATQSDYDWSNRGIVDLERANFLRETVKECALCKATAKLQVDHCHVNGTVRSMLCGRCNRSLGGFGDNPELLRKAADYVEKYNTASIVT